MNQSLKLKLVCKLLATKKYQWFPCDCIEFLHTLVTMTHFWLDGNYPGWLVGPTCRCPTRTDSNHSQTDWPRFASNYHLIYKCRQIDNIMQLIRVTLECNSCVAPFFAVRHFTLLVANWVYSHDIPISWEFSTPWRQRGVFCFFKDKNLAFIWKLGEESEKYRSYPANAVMFHTVSVRRVYHSSCNTG